jgi:hypothetical protein
MGCDQHQARPDAGPDPGLPAAGRRAHRAAAARGGLAAAGRVDSMPRAALLSIHARVAGTQPSDWEHPALVQVWGPHYSVFVVPAEDVAVFTAALLPEDDKGRRRAEDLTARLHEHLGGQRASANDAGRALGVHPNMFRYAAATGTVLIRWDGARRPDIWTVPRPATTPRDARLELARRYLTSTARSRPGVRPVGRVRPARRSGVRGARRRASPGADPGRRGVDPRRGRGRFPGRPRAAPARLLPAATPTGCTTGPPASCWFRTRPAGRAGPPIRPGALLVGGRSPGPGGAPAPC